MYNCEKCNKEFKLKQCKTNHEKYCDGNGIKRRSGDKYRVCEKCNQSVIAQGYKKHYASCDGQGILNRRRYTGKGRGYMKGKTYKEYFGEEKAQQIGNKISFKLIGKSKGISLTIEKETERRNKIRLSINKRYASGWDPKCGKCKKYDYESPIAGKIKVDGTWELNTAIYLDKIDVKWERNTTRFLYINLNGKTSTYRPDFYIHDWNSYLEIKGYETKLDKCKWKQFAQPLLIWKKEKLKELKIIA